MEDKYFDDKLKNILNSSPEFEPDEEAVSNMRSRLRSVFSGEKNYRNGEIILPLILGLFLFGSGFGLYKFNRLNAEINLLKKQHHDTLLKKDTIYEKHVVYYFDTIYTEIYKEKYVSVEKPIEYAKLEYHGNIFSHAQNNQINGFSISKMNLSWSLGSSDFSLLNKTPGSSIFEKKEAEFNTLNEVDHLPTSDLGIFPIDGYSELNGKLKEESVESRKRKINPIYYFFPEGMRVKGNYSPHIFLQSKYGGGGKIYGVNGEIELPKNRSIQIGIEYLNAGFSFSDLDNLPKIPVALPTNQSDDLAEVKAKFSCIQIPLNIRQKLLKDNALNPTIALGAVAAIPLEQKYTYEYYDSGGEYYLDAKGNNGKVSFDNLRLSLGAEYNVWKNFSLESEVVYQYGFSKDETAIFEMRYWTFQFGLNYRL